jgi:3-methylcrotonyl-CoA carboxylase alpha subunit
MIAKLIVWGSDRDEAARRMGAALAETSILGVKTNLAFLERVVAHPSFLAGDTDTGFIERHRASLLPGKGAIPTEALVAAAARVFLDEQEAIASAAPSPWNDTRGWRPNQPALRRMELRGDDGEVTRLEAEMRPGHALIEIGGRKHRVALGPRRGRECAGREMADRLQIELDEEIYFALVVRLGDALCATTPRGRYDLELVDPFHYEPADSLPDARLTALMPGRVVTVLARQGDTVRKGQALMILEAMKMEHTIVSPREGVIERVAFAENQLVPADAVLFSFKD